ncbi:hypothetical protein BGX27_003763 [Mortierella sp. AM989]|nr:hypothetical protein BGX27_003763 [Mortierella sp. AM989]
MKTLLFLAFMTLMLHKVEAGWKVWATCYLTTVLAPLELYTTMTCYVGSEHGLDLIAGGSAGPYAQYVKGCDKDTIVCVEVDRKSSMWTYIYYAEQKKSYFDKDEPSRRTVEQPTEDMMYLKTTVFSQNYF